MVSPHDSAAAMCPICDGDTHFRFSVPCDYRKPDPAIEYRIYWCRACNYGQVWERPSRDEVASYYDIDEYYPHDAAGIAKANNEDSLTDRLRTHLAWRFDHGTELTPEDVGPFGDGDHRSICEIGCGNGRNLVGFRAAGFTVTGVEPDPGARAQAGKAVDDVHDGTAEKLPAAITDQRYDVVLMSHVLEHCLDIKVAVSNARSILKESGVFIVETPNCQALGFVEYQGEWPWSDIPRHLNFFTPASLVSILVKQGFQIADRKYLGFHRQFANPWLEHEEVVWSAFSRAQSAVTRRPRFKRRAWRLLLRSLRAPDECKYDSVRFLANRTPMGATAREP